MAKFAEVEEDSTQRTHSRSGRSFNNAIQPRPGAGVYLFSPKLAALRSAGFQTYCAANFQAGMTTLAPAGLETRDTADLEVCATPNRYAGAFAPGSLAWLILLSAPAIKGPAVLTAQIKVNQG